MYEYIPTQSVPIQLPDPPAGAIGWRVYRQVWPVPHARPARRGRGKIGPYLRRKIRRMREGDTRWYLVSCLWEDGESLPGRIPR
jgi:hypothetical protein